MTPVLILARLALTEYHRRKIFTVTLLMMFLVAGMGLISNPFTIGTESRLMRDLALFFIQLYLIFFGMALGATALPNEIERKTLYAFLSKPIGRGQVLWGKFLAISVLVFANSLVLGLLLLLVLKVSTGEIHAIILAAALLSGLESMVTAGFCILFSTFMTLPVTLASVVLLYVAGALSHVYVSSLTAGNPIMRFVLVHLKSVLPYFDYFSIRSAATHNYPVSPAYLVMTIAYGCLYIVLVMRLAEAVFSWKDL